MIGTANYASELTITKNSRTSTIATLKLCNITNDDLVQLLTVRSYKRSVNQYTRDSNFLALKEMVFFNMDNAYSYHVLGYGVAPIYCFIDEKEYIERFFRQYLGLSATVSKLRIVIPTFGTDIKSFISLQFIMNSLINVLKDTSFVKYFEYTDYNGFCDNLFLNLAETSLYDTRRASSVVLYCIMLLKDFTIRDLLVSETQSRGSSLFKSRPLEYFSYYFEKFDPEEKKYIIAAIQRNSKYLEGLCNKYLTKNALTNTKRALTSASSWMIAEINGIH